MAGDPVVRFNLLHRTCKLVVLLCLLHISVTLVFYVRSLDIRFAFVQNQQSKPVLDTARNSSITAKFTIKDIQTKKNEDGEPEDRVQQGDEESGGTTEAKLLENCPETSPHLGNIQLQSTL